MTTENDFQTALDANPDDHHTRLVFADWLQERDDPRAEGYRVLGVWGLYPREDGKWESRYYRTHPWCWLGATNIPRNAPHMLPSLGWVDEMARVGLDVPNLMVFKTRRRAEDAAALAFAQLPPERRAELLAGHAVVV